MTEQIKLSDVRLDDANANAHTERGTYMLRRSMERFGFLEPAVLDANNRIIGGNHRIETAADVLDVEDALVIDIDGTRPIFVRRRDLDLTTPDGREAAVALNRTAEVGINFDISVLDNFVLAGFDFGDWFHDGEIDEMRPAGGGDDGPLAFEAKSRVTVTLLDSQLGVFEKALRATGKRKRADALMELCRAYLGDRPDDDDALLLDSFVIDLGE